MWARGAARMFDRFVREVVAGQLRVAGDRGRGGRRRMQSRHAGPACPDR